MYAWFWVDRSVHVLMNALKDHFYDSLLSYLPSSYDITIL